MPKRREGGQPGKEYRYMGETGSPPLVLYSATLRTKLVPPPNACLHRSELLLPRLHLLSRERFRLLLVLDFDARSLPPRLLGLCVGLSLARLRLGRSAAVGRSRRFPLLRRRSCVVLVLVVIVLVARFLVGNVRVFVFVKLGTELSPNRNRTVSIDAARRRFKSTQRMSDSPPPPRQTLPSRPNHSRQSR